MSRPRPLSVFSTKSLHRKSRILQEDTFDIEALRDPEEFEWKRKYRQSLNDVDLAKRFAEFMTPEMSKNFLEHNQTEFETVLESRPAALTSRNSGSSEDSTWRDFDISTPRRSRRSRLSMSPIQSAFDAEQAWRELDLSGIPQFTQQRPAPVPTIEEANEVEPTATKMSRRKRLLSPMRSFVNFIRRPSQ
ncbi:hypothetical protein AMS68_004704 [Peltaster fructicola]|uniref:Uncharacterized protein n=1 Tax=Peltaster fructicola TaxID=286661 RepID=A0A6H0XWP2_9PEZI|nr:hypothetical protein AMS68_004704 [Peltaster fructicola]